MGGDHLFRVPWNKGYCMLIWMMITIMSIAVVVRVAADPGGIDVWCGGKTICGSIEVGATQKDHITIIRFDADVHIVRALRVVWAYFTGVIGNACAEISPQATVTSAITGEIDVAP